MERTVDAAAAIASARGCTGWVDAATGYRSPMADDHLHDDLDHTVTGGGVPTSASEPTVEEQ